MVFIVRYMQTGTRINISEIKFNKILYNFSFLCLKKIFHINMLEAGVQNDGGGIWRTTLYSYI